jgi:hypothetical protein
MSDNIICLNESCGKITWSGNIVELIDNHTNEDGYFVCEHCKSLGYIKKSFGLVEPNEFWEPILRGIVKLGQPGETYQPFIYLVSNSVSAPPSSAWFCYYKDMRKFGGKLKLGHGPGGPPVLNNEQIIAIINKLISLQILDKNTVISLL